MERYTITEQIHNYRPVKKVFIPPAINSSHPKYLSISLSARKQEESVRKKSVSNVGKESISSKNQSMKKIQSKR